MPDARPDAHALALQHMLEHDLRRRGIMAAPVLEAMASVPRHLFVAAEHEHRAYADEALPSSDGQTISQPYMVAAMTQELATAPGQLILELGTGTGYQTAVLATLVGPAGRILTIEQVPALAAAAQRRLLQMSYANVSFCTGDGSTGWPRERWGEAAAPRFDRILVTAAAPSIPQPLIDQLAPGGLLLLPLENPKTRHEMLTRIERTADGLRQTELFACTFVPLLGEHAYQTPPTPRG